MPLFLGRRQPELVEYMDRDDADREMLFRTYRQFGPLNRLVAGWGSHYRRHLRPRMSHADRPWRLLDIGCGGGDIPRHLLDLAQRDGLGLQIVGIDPDPRAIAYLRQHSQPDAFAWREATLDEVAESGERFDGVISNHVLHHLPAGELNTFLATSRAVADSIVIHNDLRRSDGAYAAFALAGSLCFRRSYIVRDGLLSLRRAWTLAELRAELPTGWSAQWRPLGHLAIIATSEPSP